MKNILLGITGSISAYRSCDIANEMTKKGYNVKVILTKSGEKFITPLTLEKLSRNRVYLDTFDEHDPSKIDHVELAKWADIFIIAPATANIIGKLANGIADDLLSSTALIVNGQKIIAPAMNTAMYENPIVQENIKKLERYGYSIIEPRVSLLACLDYGKGALPNVEDIVNVLITL